MKLRTAYRWEHMTGGQQTAALRDMKGVTPDGKPPSGAGSVFWVFDGRDWTWRSILGPDDFRNGIQLAADPGKGGR